VEPAQEATSTAIHPLLRPKIGRLAENEQESNRDSVWDNFGKFKSINMGKPPAARKIKINK
jgi:hypothetical protein